MSLSNHLTKQITDYGDANSIGSRLRRRRLKSLLPMVDAVFAQHREVRIIDIGGTRRYWSILDGQYLRERNIQIALVNLPGQDLPRDEEHFTYREGNACDLQVDDRAYHIAHSNSVIEHVGDWSNMHRFASEVRRVASHHFVQTPNYWFPVEPHCMTPFIHWLPRPLRVRMVMQFSLGNWPRASGVDQAVRLVEGARLLNYRMFQALFPDSDIRSERILGLRKSLIAVSRGSGAI